MHFTRFAFCLFMKLNSLKFCLVYGAQLFIILLFIYNFRYRHALTSIYRKTVQHALYVPVQSLNIINRFINLYYIFNITLSTIFLYFLLIQKVHIHLHTQTHTSHTNTHTHIHSIQNTQRKLDTVEGVSLSAYLDTSIWRLTCKADFSHAQGRFNLVAAKKK